MWAIILSLLLFLPLLVEEVVRKRKMIREYNLDKQIPEEIITKLIKNAHRAPRQVILRFKNL
jgi:hypothetical protein